MPQKVQSEGKDNEKMIKNSRIDRQISISFPKLFHETTFIIEKQMKFK